MKMLLMIPMDVIESVPAIREYLDSDSNSERSNRWKTALAEMIQRNQQALDASADAMLFCTTGGIIEYSNSGRF